MHHITLCYSTHRPETQALTARIMKNHDVILLEEPLHPDFHKALGGTVNLEDHLLEFDRDYPAFTLGQYRLLQQFFHGGKELAAVKKLSIEQCTTLFQRIRSSTSSEAAEITEKYLR